jgi:hypothetical protein
MNKNKNKNVLKLQIKLWLMLNVADARRPASRATPMSAAHLYWRLGVGSDVTQSAVQFIQCHLSCKLDNGYVKI